MLFWKLVFILDLIVNVGFWRAILRGEEQLGRLDAACIPIGAMGTFGLATYAFSLPALPETFWRGFLPVFIAIASFEIAKTAVEIGIDVGALVGVLCVMILVGLTSVGIYRLGGSEWIGVFGI